VADAHTHTVLMYFACAEYLSASCMGCAGSLEVDQLLDRACTSLHLPFLPPSRLKSILTRAAPSRICSGGG
jgi:hypothetical protein